VFAAGHGDGAKLVAGGAVLGHVALRDHGVTGRRAKPAEQSAAIVAIGLLVGLTRAGGRVVGQRHHGDLALAGLDGHGGVADHADVAGAAVVVNTADARLHAQRLGQLLRVHHLELGGGRLDQQAIDLALFDARIGQRLADRLDIERHRAAPRVFAEGGVADARDDDSPAQCVGHQMTPSACRPAISSAGKPSQSP